MKRQGEYAEKRDSTERPSTAVEASIREIWDGTCRDMSQRGARNTDEGKKSLTPVLHTNGGNLRVFEDESKSCRETS